MKNVVSVWDLFDAMARDFDGLFDTIDKYSGVIPANFPPTNFYVDEEKNIRFEFALAGYSLDEIELNFDGDKMFLTLTPNKKEEVEGERCVTRGIKHSSSKTYYVVPSSKYDHSAATADYTDGVLVVNVPAREEAKPKKTKINIKK